MPRCAPFRISQTAGEAREPGIAAEIGVPRVDAMAPELRVPAIEWGAGDYRDAGEAG